MNVLNASNEMAFLNGKSGDLLGLGLDPLSDFAGSVDKLRKALDVLSKAGDEAVRRRVDRMHRQLDGFEPSVTMIGQIKSGKTSLVNAMIGQPDLLPADVNPWTSVVTSLHLNPEQEGFENHASFRFFDEDEWDRLVSGGGRIGEMASRAGADEELEKIKRQVAAMREKSRARLGRKFEVLLGQQRDYGYFDKDLIERYVCLGEEPDTDDSPAADVQGRFADITKAADLHMTRPSLPWRLCIRDTPGVNDTFMMREQITIRAIRDSKLCVVILSAHQALSSTDMALIRLISNAKSRDIIIFVNRVDELSDPLRQVPQIQQSIAATLRMHKGPQDAEVIFGSALWAAHALQNRLDALPAASLSALKNWEASMPVSGVAPNQRVDQTSAWQLSGLPALNRAIADRIVQGAGGNLLQRIAASAKNLTTGIVAADRIASTDQAERQTPALTSEAARSRIKTSIEQHLKHLRVEFDDILLSFSERLERVQQSFLDRATASLVDHLERSGDAAPWTYDPAGLRVLLSSSHKVFARNSAAAFDKATQSAVRELAGIYEQAFALSPEDLDISLPRAPSVPAPVALGRTIALDLSAGWWKRWWMHRRGYQAYAASFYDLIKSETTPFLSELRDDLAESVKREAITGLETFLNEQMSVFETLDQQRHSGPDGVRDLAARTSPVERKATLERAVAIFNRFADI